jgi:hypothetical protein
MKSEKTIKNNLKLNKKTLGLCAVGVSILGFGGLFFSNQFE